MTGWIDRFLAAIGLGGRKPEADVSYDPAQHDSKQGIGVADKPMTEQYVGRSGDDADETGQGAAPGGP